jgi:hypothetical protein
MKKNKKNEIKWNLINSGIAGLLVFVGAFADGSITQEGIIVALSASAVIFLNKFKEYWTTTGKKGSCSMFNFI